MGVKDAEMNITNGEMPSEIHLKRRLSKLTMIGMTFAILKKVIPTADLCSSS
jgi:hypothetical protein